MIFTQSFKRPTPGRRVKDAPTRVSHWLMAACFLITYITSESERFRLLHVTVGYTLLGLLGFRLLYGLLGPRHARIAATWRKAASLPIWCRTTWQQLSRITTPTPINWHQGRLMVTPALTLLMLALVVPITLSGYLTFNEIGGSWGEDVFGEIHEFFGNAMLASVLGHMAWLILSSLFAGRNEIAPMLHGAVPGAGPDIVKHNHLWLAIALVLMVTAYIAWEWTQSPRGLIRLW